MDLTKLKQSVYQANMALKESGLVISHLATYPASIANVLDGDQAQRCAL